jgi:hypothetical protein
MLGLALLIILKHDSSDSIVTKLAETLDRVVRCESAKKMAYNMLITHAATLMECQHIRAGGASTPPTALAADSLLRGECQKPVLESQPESQPDPQPEPEPEPQPQPAVHMVQPGAMPSEDLGSKEGAMARFLSCVEDYVDDHKDAAYRSAWLEPSRFYFDVLGDETSRDHVNVHALNAYLCLLRGGLGVQMPIVPEEYDGCSYMGLCDVWRGLSDAAFVEHFSLSENFGKAFEGIKSLQSEGGQARLVRNWSCGRNMHGGGSAGPLDCGRPLDLEQRAANGHDLRLAVYLERFAWFFRPEFLVRRLFEVLNAETKPEHAGFSRAAETLFQIYRQEKLLKDAQGDRAMAEGETLVEHVYDEMCTTLDVRRTAAFLSWTGVVRSDVVEQLSSTPHDSIGLDPMPGSGWRIAADDVGAALGRTKSQEERAVAQAAQASTLAEIMHVSVPVATAALAAANSDIEQAVTGMLAKQPPQDEEGVPLPDVDDDGVAGDSSHSGIDQRRTLHTLGFDFVAPVGAFAAGSTSLTAHNGGRGGGRRRTTSRGRRAR